MIIRYLMIATLICAGLCARNAWAQPDCSDWSSESFLESATIADVKKCLAAGADFNPEDKDGWTPLHMAALHGDAEKVAALIDAGADMEARTNSISISSRSGGAGVEGFGADLLEVLEGGLGSKKVEGSRTETSFSVGSAGGPLFEGSGLEDGYQSRTVSWSTVWTPLHVAAVAGNAETVVVLIKAGADIRAKTDDGKLPADLAEDNYEVKNHDIFRVLDAARRE